MRYFKIYRYRQDLVRGELIIKRMIIWGFTRADIQLAIYNFGSEKSAFKGLSINFCLDRNMIAITSYNVNLKDFVTLNRNTFHLLIKIFSQGFLSPSRCPYKHKAT